MKKNNRCKATGVQDYRGVFTGLDLNHISHKARSDTYPNMAANRPPPGRCNQKNAGETEAFSHMARISISTPIKGSTTNQVRRAEPMSSQMAIAPTKIKIMLMPNRWMWVHFRVQTNCSCW